MNKFQTMAVAVVFGLMFTHAPTIGRGDEPAQKCDRCGSTCVTCKVCRSVEETKKVSKTEYDCECEDFCVPGPSNLCGYDKSCDECGNVKCTKIWQPTCAQVRSRKVLKKKTVEEEVKGFKWIVEELCDTCAAAGDPPAVEKDKPADSEKKSSGSAAFEFVPDGNQSSVIAAAQDPQASYDSPETRAPVTFFNNAASKRSAGRGR